MNEVSGNPDYVVLLRAVSTPIGAVEMLYVAASLLQPNRNKEQRAANAALCLMTARMLGLNDDNYELVERVLRSLPDPT